MERRVTGNCHARCEPGESGENCNTSSDRYLSGLKITSDGRKLGLDQRIIDPLLPDEPGTKVNRCVENILSIWREGAADRLTQLVFCDISTPQAPVKKARGGDAAGGCRRPGEALYRL